jgi:hypothetical protein
MHYLSKTSQEIMDQNGWSYRPFEINDLEEYRQLITTEYGEEAEIANPEFINWQYRKNPAGEAKISLAVSKETKEIVGSYSILPIEVNLGAKEKNVAGLSLNTLTRKDFRGKKIFTTLAEINIQELFSQNYSLIYGFPNPNSYPGFLKYLKFNDIQQFPLLYKYNNLGSILQKKKGLPFTGLMNFFGNFFTGRIKSPPNSNDFLIQEVTSFDVRFDDFWEKNKNQFPNLVQKNCEYLNWRYCENPVKDYQIFCLSKKNDSRILGFVVCRVDQIEGLKIGLIGEILVENMENEYIQMLLVQAEQYFIGQDVDAYGGILSPNTRYYNSFLSCGFKVFPKKYLSQPFAMIVRVNTDLEKQEKKLLDSQNWFITLGDYDIF